MASDRAPSGVRRARCSLRCGNIRLLRRVGDALEAKGGVDVADMCGAAMMAARSAVPATMAVPYVRFVWSGAAAVGEGEVARG
ncbi:hypothetical protein Srubr_03540 [Streptomyces rubradiris]|uniref:Uncharacterized protein n=1 Tax=Streptomyces rubradiris TaxID=285531 RepID=A0ABQ3R3T3_STRRR|nr:hypothetical protein GCM10018792_22600 [Streptomyces rubradiris]GHI50508.1 hypothetical protein Srubr_03540 [Streptomyces rubradiris]